MKFDFCIGNPPYQEESVGDRLSDKPVYNYFLDAAFSVAHKVEMIHPARFLFNAGSTPKEWNKKMLSDNHFKILEFSPMSNDYFNGISFTGGVAISYFDVFSDFNPIDVFTVYPQLNSIKQKVVNHNFSSFVNILFNENKFLLNLLYSDFPDYVNFISSAGRERRLTTNVLAKLPLFSDIPNSFPDFKILGLIGGKRVYRYISQKYIDSNHKLLNSWKVIVSVANGAAGVICDVPVRIMGMPIIEPPGVGYTQSFIGIGPFDNKIQAENCSKYLQTKFVRIMIGLLKVTQLIHSDVWKFVPLQDFTDKSDIDWSKSVKEIDQQLYRKYGLTQDEIGFIESKVKEME